MKRRQKATYFLAGVLAALLLICTASPAMAAVAGKTITVYPGVGMYLNDIKIEPTDVNGSPVDVFYYNGTTYVPIRAVSKAFGLPIQWDGSTRSVYIGKHAQAASYLLDICTPYATSGSYNTPDYITMCGQKYMHCFQIDGVNGDGSAYFNLNGSYDTLDFDYGLIDGSAMHDGELLVYLDGELTDIIDLSCESMVRHATIDLDGALQLKFEWSHLFVPGNIFLGKSTQYGFANVTVS